MLINIHTHKRTSLENQLEIVGGEDTIGIHPWNLSLNPNFDQAAEMCRMIGETGLDRSEKYVKDLKLQEDYLQLHIEAARYFKLPIVIHCVRAHSDLLRLLKKNKYSGKILLHDYSGNINQAAEYLKYDTYFSFWRNLEHMKFLPKERVFLETDDQVKFSLIELYQLVQFSEKQFEENLLAFFGDSKEVRSADVINYFIRSLISH